MKTLFDDKATNETNVLTKVNDFLKEISTLEVVKDSPIIIYQDGASKAYYIDCHILSIVASDLFDYDASLDPEEQEEIKANRDLQDFHKAFGKMKEDAKKGRQFNDIIVEYLPSGSKVEKPLKIYGGQHRAKSIEESTTQNVERYHGFRVYFELSVQQRNEIAQVSNTNINVPIDLFERMQETLLGPELRKWCVSIGLLSSNQDFAERKNSDGIITARMARTFIINFMAGKKIKGPISDKPYVSLIGNDVNKEYLGLTKEQRLTYLKDSKLKEAGDQFAVLHKTQMQKIKQDKDLSKTSEFKTKALTPCILSAWSFVAGLLQKDKGRLKKLYQLTEKSKDMNPLAAKEMSEYKHQSDPKNYRGLGTRTEKKERGKLVQLFLLYSGKQEPKIITRLIDAAVTNYLSFALDEERKKKAAKVR
jgi:hypothetical protein